MAEKHTGNQNLDRRKFLKLAGGAIGATILACSGVTFIGTRRPKITLSSTNCGDTAAGKILVAYATRCGSTIGIAQTIGETFCNGGATVEVKPIKEVDNIDEYHAVIVGSAIRMGRWLPEAVKFVETHRGALANVPSAYFAVCLTLNEDSPANRQEAESYLDPVREIFEPNAIGLFAGALMPETLSAAERLVMNAMDSQQGDFRNWDAVEKWAEGINPSLS